MGFPARVEMNLASISLGAVARKAAIFVLAYAAYVAVGTVIHGYLRGAALNASSHTYSAGPAEQALFHGMPVEWLQDWTPAGGGLFPAAAVFIWLTLFYVPLLLCALVLATRGMRAFLGLLALHAVLVFSADIFYSLFPTRPPWMDLSVTRIVAEATDNATAADNNPFASVPSLHIAVPVAYALWFLTAEGRRFRALGGALAVWGLAMTWAVVYTGEHYLIGALSGVVWAWMAYGALHRIGVLHPRVASVLAEPRPVSRPALVPLEPSSPEYEPQRYAA